MDGDRAGEEAKKGDGDVLEVSLLFIYAMRGKPWMGIKKGLSALRGGEEDDIMMTNGQKTRNLTQLVELPTLRCEVDCEMRNMF